ncbi:MAG TPA: MaoC family dehydratase [Burkholderiales bacterium]|nr:MaoC family dehydratase [Burkholderiales bacterium]
MTKIPGRSCSARNSRARSACVRIVDSCLGVGFRKVYDQLRDRWRQPMTVRYLEDFAVGQKFASGRLRVDKERIQAFAAEFDPQPFHLDDEAARGSIFKGLAASGWHTAAMTMRLLVDSELKPAGGIVGAGFDEFRWPRPVRPGDELRVESEILEVRPSRSRPEQGMIKVRTTTYNQTGEAVQINVGNLVVPRRS